MLDKGSISSSGCHPVTASVMVVATEKPWHTRPHCSGGDSQQATRPVAGPGWGGQAHEEEPRNACLGEVGKLCCESMIERPCKKKKKPPASVAPDVRNWEWG